MDQESNFEIGAYRHQASHPNFRNGIWYGTIDGHGVTAPASSEGCAIGWAKASLKTGSYLAGVKDQKMVFENWIKQGVTGEKLEEAKKNIAEAEARLEKYYKYFGTE